MKYDTDSLVKRL